MSRLKRLTKECAHRVLPPSVFQRLTAVRSRKWQLKSLEASGLLDQVTGYIEEHGTVVQSGPFAGMIYPLESAINRWSIPKLLGTYESELHPFLAAFGNRTYECILDIGSAEGYYACGLARMFKTPVYAYDPEPNEKGYSAKMSKRNGISDLVIMSDLFTLQEMRRFSPKRALVLCDCEGFEEALFRSETMDLTRNWDLLIELHGTADRVLPLLAWPHTTIMVDAQQKRGQQDERRILPQRFLVCDSGGDAPTVLNSPG